MFWWHWGSLCPVSVDVGLAVGREEVTLKGIHRTGQRSSKWMEGWLCREPRRLLCFSSSQMSHRDQISIWQMEFCSEFCDYGSCLDMCHQFPYVVSHQDLGLVIKRPRTGCKILDPGLSNEAEWFKGADVKKALIVDVLDVSLDSAPYVFCHVLITTQQEPFAQVKTLHRYNLQGLKESGQDLW